MEPYEIGENYQYIQVSVHFTDGSEQSFSVRMIPVKEINELKIDILSCFEKDKACMIANTIINLEKVNLITFKDIDPCEESNKKSFIKKLFGL